MKRFISYCLSALFCIVFASCKQDLPGAPSIKTFVLVHGAWQGPYAWQLVKASLEKKGQKVIVVELPGHGKDTTSPATLTIESYRDKVIAAIQSAKCKVVLVGHSMGGMVVSAVAEKNPAQIEKLIYLGAFVPAGGQSLLDLALTDSDSHLAASLVPSKDQLTLGIRPDSLVPVFCADASISLQQLVVDNYRSEPAIPFTSKVALSAAFAGVDKYYIHTTEDKAIGLKNQQRMAAAAHIKFEYNLQTSHCPFLSAPESVSDLLYKISR